MAVQAQFLGGSELVAAKEPPSIEELLTPVREFTEHLSKSLSVNSMTSLEVEFGISASVQSGHLIAAIAKLGTSVNMRVTMKFERAVTEK